MRIDVDTSTPHAKRTCTELAMARRKGSNYELLKLFQKYSSVDEARAHCPIELSQPDWDKKCDYFSSEAFKKRSETNKDRASQTVTHCMGPRSFVAAKAKEEKTRGKPLGRCELWKCSRHTETNDWCCDQARVIHEEMEERLNQPVSEGGTRPT